MDVINKLVINITLDMSVCCQGNDYINQQNIIAY